MAEAAAKVAAEAKVVEEVVAKVVEEVVVWAPAGDVSAPAASVSVLIVERPLSTNRACHVLK